MSYDRWDERREPRLRSMDRQYIIEEIKRTSAANGGQPLGLKRFFAETGIRPSDCIGKYWANWGDAVREAGFSANEFQGAYGNDFLLEKLAVLTRDLGHFPVGSELRIRARSGQGFPSHNTFARFGGKSQLSRALVRWCESTPGWDDVRDVASAVADAKPPEREEPAGQPIFGSVYLMKSGKYYKIGRSNSLGRRQYELAIQLPDPVAVVHQIKTDDPAGIEAYWHRRFADRRKAGEWFELSKEDVAAFLRRKFM